jgi:hypothetical protein
MVLTSGPRRDRRARRRAHRTQHAVLQVVQLRPERGDVGGVHAVHREPRRVLAGADRPADLRPAPAPTAAGRSTEPAFGLALWALSAPENADAVIGGVVEWITRYFGWWYFSLAAGLIAFVLIICLSRVGRYRLGPDE